MEMQAAFEGSVDADTTCILRFLYTDVIPEHIAAEVVFRTDAQLDALIVAAWSRMILAAISSTTSTLVGIACALETPSDVAAIEVLSTDTRRDYRVITPWGVIWNTATACAIPTIRSARDARFRRITNIVSTTFSGTIRSAGT